MTTSRTGADARLVKVFCPDCRFRFYLEEGEDLSPLRCPRCGQPYLLDIENLHDGSGRAASFSTGIPVTIDEAGPGRDDPAGGTDDEAEPAGDTRPGPGRSETVTEPGTDEEARAALALRRARLEMAGLKMDGTENAYSFSTGSRYIRSMMYLFVLLALLMVLLAGLFLGLKSCAPGRAAAEANRPRHDPAGPAAGTGPAGAAIVFR